MIHPLLILLAWAMLGSGMLAGGQPADHDTVGVRPEAQAEAESGEERAADASPDPRERPRVKMELRIDPEALRVRLERSILRSQQMLERHRSALAKLDEGASAGEVLAELRFDGLEDRRANRQSPRPARGVGEQPEVGESSMSLDERERMHGFLAEYFPELWANLSPIIRQDPQSADRLLARMSGRIREILLLRQSEPELADIKIRQMRVGLDFVEALRIYRMTLRNDGSSDRDHADALATMRDLAAARFDAELEAKQYEVDRLRTRLDELEDSVEQIESRRDAEIEHMLTAAVRSARRQSVQGGEKSRDD